MDIRSFCQQQREWLNYELESDAAAEETTTKNGDQRRSSSLTRLIAEDISLGLYGRTVVCLAYDENRLLPSHSFTPGDEVEVRSKQRKFSPSGVVCQVTDDSISVALFGKRNSKSDNNTDEDEVVGEPPLSLIPKSSVEVHRRLVQTLDELGKQGTSHPLAGRIVRAVMEEPLPNNEVNSPAITPLNSSLDASQVEAVRFCLSARPVALIHGPPGTGKTTTVVELIKQAVQTFNLKVLVTAPSNVAVDNVLAKLVDQSLYKGKHKNKRIRAVRLGHPARLQPGILPYSLEAQVQSADGTDIVKDVRNELESFIRVATNPKAKYNDKRVAYREIKILRKEVRTREEKVVQSLLSNAQVVLATCVGAANKLLKNVEFDLVVIDEAAQALESACWIPALLGKKLVLAGDHCQLPPTIKSTRSDVQKGLGCTMFERVMSRYGDDSGPPEGRVSRMLNVQYRMNHNIADWASRALYHDKLQTSENIRNQTLSELPNTLSDFPALFLVDTAGCSLFESVNQAGSRFNEGECRIVVQHVQSLLDSGITAEQIAVITPYNGQVDLLKGSLHGIAAKLEVRSVDGFQGGEREAVVLSLVRSSEHGGKSGIGFLGEERRLNVAVTRAKRHCCIVCDSDTVSQSPFIKELVQWFVEFGDTRSALEYGDESTTDFLAEDLLQAEILLNAEKSIKRKPEPNISKGDQKKSLALDNILRDLATFAATADPGSSHTLSTELTGLDRRRVHEESEKLGILHVSEGEGLKRRITVSIPSTIEQEKGSEKDGQDAALNDAPVEDEEDGVPSNLNMASLPFTELADSPQSSDGEISDSKERNTPEQTQLVRTAEKTNNVLADLARERMERQKRQKPTNKSPSTTTAQSSKKKNKKKGGQRLGGQKKSAPAVSTDKGLEDLDDMAFLDAQIEQVQTSHGRVVQGSGKKYKSIVNGMLVAKPKQEERKRDTRASNALQNKLKKAQDARKTQGKKKG